MVLNYENEGNTDYDPKISCYVGGGGFGGRLGLLLAGETCLWGRESGHTRRKGMVVTAKPTGRLWFGFLEAGKSSSPVMRDAVFDTGNHETTYLFNLAKGRILEYRRDIVEQKLRELSLD